MPGLQTLWAEFDRAAPAHLDLLVGDSRAEFAGPLWLRLPAPVGLAMLGMPFWAGKRFAAPVDGVAQGVNLLQVRGHTRQSIPITASVEQGDVAVRYPRDAAWPWPGVVDRLRVRNSHTLLGMTFGFPGMPARGLPFLLHVPGD